MACAFRTNTYLTLSLPMLIWKKFTLEKIINEDLYEIDLGVKYLYNFINECSV